MGVIEVIEPGLLTTVQDVGRFGYLRHGVPVSGAMDPVALRLANLLVGNPEGEACLEVTLSGPRLRFRSAAVIAVTGADLSPSINGSADPDVGVGGGAAGGHTFLRGAGVGDTGIRGGGGWARTCRW